MSQPTHFFVPCAGAGMPNACKHNALVPIAAFGSEQALARALWEKGWRLFIGEVELKSALECIYLAFCLECSVRYSKDVSGAVAQVTVEVN
jgi:hypothetical protein